MSLKEFIENNKHFLLPQDMECLFSEHVSLENKSISELFLFKKNFSKNIIGYSNVLRHTYDECFIVDEENKIIFINALEISHLIEHGVTNYKLRTNLDDYTLVDLHDWSKEISKSIIQIENELINNLKNMLFLHYTMEEKKLRDYAIKTYIEGGSIPIKSIIVSSKGKLIKNNFLKNISQDFLVKLYYKKDHLYDYSLLEINKILENRSTNWYVNNLIEEYYAYYNWDKLTTTMLDMKKLSLAKSIWDKCIEEVIDNDIRVNGKKTYNFNSVWLYNNLENIEYIMTKRNRKIY